jgi:hypothetical protein
VVTVVVGLCFGGRDQSDGPEESAVVEPVDPLKDLELDRVSGPPGASALDDLGL